MKLWRCRFRTLGKDRDSSPRISHECVETVLADSLENAIKIMREDFFGVDEDGDEITDFVWQSIEFVSSVDHPYKK